MSGDHNMHCSANQPTLREAAQQALEAWRRRDYDIGQYMEALASALAQQEQAEPVASDVLRRWATYPEDGPTHDWHRGYEAARRWVREVGLPVLERQGRAERRLPMELYKE